MRPYGTTLARGVPRYGVGVFGVTSQPRATGASGADLSKASSIVKSRYGNVVGVATRKYDGVRARYYVVGGNWQLVLFPTEAQFVSLQKKGLISRTLAWPSLPKGVDGAPAVDLYDEGQIPYTVETDVGTVIVDDPVSMSVHFAADGVKTPSTVDFVLGAVGAVGVAMGATARALDPTPAWFGDVKKWAGIAGIVAVGFGVLFVVNTVLPR